MEDLIRNVLEVNKKKIGKCLKESKIVTLSFEDINSVEPEVANKLLDEPYKAISSIEQVLKEFMLIEQVTFRLDSLPEISHIKIREVRTKHIGGLIKLSGIVKKASVVRPREILVRFSCPECDSVLTLAQNEKRLTKPSRCSCGYRGKFKILSRDMIDIQNIVLEENTEDCNSMQPQKIKAILKNDLVEPKMHLKTRPGSRVELYGILKDIRQTTSQGIELVDYDIVVDVNNIIHLDDYEEDLEISDEDIAKIKAISEMDNPLDELVKSVSPSIFGNDSIKKALALQLFKGVSRNRSDGTWIRGDIHILLIGDPSGGKSVMLTFMNSIAPNSRLVSGKTTSAAGLIAGVSKEEDGWCLEAGAMVLSNGGLINIDEFEKMGEDDRSSMHQAMEQQQINISKISIQATLPTRTAVLAAANPKYGRFLPDMDLAKQINMVPTLLSRFDFIYILRDTPDETKDLMIANKILEEHHGKIVPLDPYLLKKYILYANRNFKPELTGAVKKEILDFYVKMRQINGDNKTSISITPRQLESIIRLSEAHAKIRLSNRVTLKDVEVAKSLIIDYLKSIGYDEQNNVYDINKIASGTTSKANVLNHLIKCMINMKAEGAKLDMGEVYSKTGMTDFEEFEKLIDKLAKEGYIIRPDKGRLFLL